MPISRTYACDFCGGLFKFLHMTRDEPPPSYCDLCGAIFEEEPEAELPAPAIGGSAIGKSVDQVHRQLEAPGYDSNGNVVRAGITNMNDRLRPGDVAAKPIENIVTQFQKEMGSQPWSGATTSEYLQMSRTGPAAGTGGNIALAALQSRKNS